MSDPMRIPLRNAAGDIVAYTLVDAEDYAEVNRWTWTFTARNYVGRNSKTDPTQPSHVNLHRWLMGCTPGDGTHVDHINRDTLDNRRANLRVVTPAQSAQNKPALKGRYRGVSFNRSKGKWQAYAQLDGRRYNLGRYDDEVTAAAVAAEWRAQNMPFAVELDDLPPAPPPRVILHKSETHCAHGHPWTAESIYVWRGARHCRECRRIADRKRKARRSGL